MYKNCSDFYTEYFYGGDMRLVAYHANPYTKDMKLFRGDKQKAVSNLAKTTIVKTVNQVKPINQSPDEAFGKLFDAVQKQSLYADGKTFVDMVPKKRAQDIKRLYQKAAKKPAFDLSEFVSENFTEYKPHNGQEQYVPDGSLPIRTHITYLWDELTRRNRRDRGSLLALPYPYVVPGGRFEEQFYWDSYFIMLGLAADGRWDLIDGMMKNYTYMIRKIGFIPTANRTYFLSRSQPPFFVYMVKLLAQKRGQTQTLAEYLPYMLLEYRFWMKGRKVVNGDNPFEAYKRVVKMPDGTILNRYYDNKTTPRPESHREDLATVARAGKADDAMFVHLRAGAESGWDFSSRWFYGGTDIEHTSTTDLVPVDLNCLLYTLEYTIGQAYALTNQPVVGGKFIVAAERRAQAIQTYCWSKKQQYFVDYNFQHRQQMSCITLAGVYPLYVKIATKEQAQCVAQRIENEFLKKGGLATTLSDTGQQWDSPNGWAPLQWVAIQGLRNYGYTNLANTIRDRWLKTNELVYEKRHKMIEKYDVVTPGALGGGGEYALQDGFGWTNGVYAALKDNQIYEQQSLKKRNSKL